MVLGRKKYKIRLPNGRKNFPRDNTKLRIAKYLFEKECDVSATPYEIIHHASISMHDYPYLKKILNEMVDANWLNGISSGKKTVKKICYVLTERGRNVISFIRNLPVTHPLRDLDTFYGI